MQTIGLIGGMSWHSTVTYYQAINLAVAERLGGHASAQVVLQSLDFERIRDFQRAGDWDGAAATLAEAARRCVAGGADAVAICTNLMHKVAPQVAASVDVPLVHIADAVGDVAERMGVTRLGVLGARWVMEETFYSDVLGRRGIATMAPDAPGRELVDRVIFDELTQGICRDDSRAAYLRIIDDLKARGAQAVVLACTEIGLLVDEADSSLPLIDSAQAHSAALADFVLEGEASRAA